jgi:hypothetical protein
MGLLQCIIELLIRVHWSAVGKWNVRQPKMGKKTSEMSISDKLPILNGTHKLFPRRDETLHMEARHFGFFPQAFVWGGRQYQVQVVERYWTVLPRRLWDVKQYCFRVHCVEGTFDLCEDVKRHTWHVDRFERR